MLKLRLYTCMILRNMDFIYWIGCLFFAYRVPELNLDFLRGSSTFENSYVVSVFWRNSILSFDVSDDNLALEEFIERKFFLHIIKAQIPAITYLNLNGNSFIFFFA